jgi:hypothetical protein
MHWNVPILPEVLNIGRIPPITVELPIAKSKSSVLQRNFCGGNG